MIETFEGYQIIHDLPKITYPALGLISLNEGAIMIKEAMKFFDNISSAQKKLYVYSSESDESDESDDHCQLVKRSRGIQIMFDWLYEIFSTN